MEKQIGGKSFLELLTSKFLIVISSRNLNQALFEETVDNILNIIKCTTSIMVVSLKCTLNYTALLSTGLSAL